jgi:hypothetical protein
MNIKIVSSLQDYNVKYLKIIKGRTSEYGTKPKAIDYI